MVGSQWWQRNGLTVVGSGDGSVVTMVVCLCSVMDGGSRDNGRRGSADGGSRSVGDGFTAGVAVVSSGGHDIVPGGSVWY